MSFDALYKHLDHNGDGTIDAMEIRTLFFGDMMSAPGIPKRPYAECSDWKAMQSEIEAHLKTYNEMSSKPMDLVCFLFMLEHLSRVCRVIKSPGGNALLVGVGGSGRQSCVRLACFLADFSVFQIELAKGYNMEAFREDMKKMLVQAGANGEHTVFLFTDSQIKDEGFVEDINNLLNTGEIPNLMLPEDKDEITNGVRPVCNEKKIVDTVDNIANLFVDRVREMLHICLCMSPVGDSLRIRCRQFPSLVNCMTLDYFSSWPEQALLDVSTMKLAELDDVTEE